MTSFEFVDGNVLRNLLRLKKLWAFKCKSQKSQEVSMWKRAKRQGRGMDLTPAIGRLAVEWTNTPAGGGASVSPSIIPAVL